MPPERLLGDCSRSTAPRPAPAGVPDRGRAANRAGIHFRTADGYLYYNAGVDPDARDLSPGVLMVAEYVRRALAEGVRRLDFLRGDEPYKYEWGRSTSRSSACSSDDTEPRVSAPTAWDPASRRCRHRGSVDRARIRVVEILATGTSGGAQEHLFNLMSRLEPSRLTRASCRCRPAAPSASWSGRASW